MKKIILTKGLPASGKTTFAKELMLKEPNKWKRVNKDELRLMLDCGKWSKDNEKFILLIRDTIITFSMLQGFNIIIDDTNLAPKHEAKIREMINLHNTSLLPERPEQYELEIKDFTNVPLEECLSRDRKRPNAVGDKVILTMYKQFLKPIIPQIKIDSTLPDAVICDIDGTLALFGKNNPYDRDFSKDFLNAPVVEILKSIRYWNQDREFKVILVSGRMEKNRKVTEEWLSCNGIPFDKLYMRVTDDVRKDVIVKKEIYKVYIRGQYNIKMVIDDRNQVVEMWRQEGLTCIQVAEGDF